MIQEFMVFSVKKFLIKLPNKINKADVVKISGTGHYLFKGEPYSVYFRMLKM